MSNQKKRPEVVAIYNEVADFLTGKEFAFLLNFGGLTVAQIGDLRRQLLDKGARMMVIKNTFIAKILAERGIQFPEGVLSGPTAVIAGQGDIADAAKTVVDFVKKNEKATIKAGLIPAGPPPRHPAGPRLQDGPRPPGQGRQGRRTRFRRRQHRRHPCGLSAVS